MQRSLVKARRARLRMQWPLRLLTIATAVLVSASAFAADRIRIATQKTGTFAWELAVIRDHGLDRKAGLELVVTEFASTEAGKIALKSGSADIIVSDWLWVARDRALGGQLVFRPFASTLGAVMVRAGSGINDVADLKGKRLAVAGGPLDKSWLMLQALARRSGVDLRKDASVVYGAPPLLSQKALQGEQDATLTFWNFAAVLEGKGFARAIDVADVQRRLGARDQVAILGYVFDGAWAEKHRPAVERFLRVAHEAKEMLAASAAEWAKLGSRIGISDPALLAIFRERYARGIPRRSVEEEERDARVLYRVLAEIGGAELVGPAQALDKDTFWPTTPGN